MELVFVTVFIQFISPTTPLIRKDELEEAMRRQRGFRGDRNDDFLRVLSSQGDKYALVMNSIVSSPKRPAARQESNSQLTPLRSKNKAAERIRKYRRRVGPGEVQDFTRDWTTAQFHKPKYVVPRLEQRHDSLPARRPFPAPRHHSLTERHLTYRQKGKVLRRKQIMVEFTPKRLVQNSEDTPIDIQPLIGRRRRGRRKLPLLDRTMQIERLEDVSISPGAQSCLVHT